VSPLDRAKAAHAAAELADHPRDKAALRAAAYAWERIAGPGVAWSTKDLRRDLRALRIDTAMATGPFTKPQPPKAPRPSAVTPPVYVTSPEWRDEDLTPAREVSSIQF
jgi:hypothetical protein